MSRTYSLVCHETKQTLWIGQGPGMSTFYSGHADCMERLGRFLSATIGHQLVVECDDLEGFHEGYTEFKSPVGDRKENDHG